ncbi:MAG: hypothetical protein WKI04_14365 [Ferruginibacter sp.]
MNVLYAYGMETAYFGFPNLDKLKLYSTLSISLFLSSIVFTILLWFGKGAVTDAADLNNHPEFVLWMIAIIAADNLNTLPLQN